MPYSIDRYVEVELYGNKAEEKYTFTFNQESGECVGITRKVGMDSSGNGITATVAQQETEIPLSEVPSSVRKDVRQTLHTSYDELRITS